MPSKAAMQAMQKITAGPEPLPEEKRMELLEKSMAKYIEESKKSTVFDKDVSDLVARFEEAELVTGKKLGSGGFCDVFQIDELKLNSKGSDAHEDKIHDKIEEYHTRGWMSKTCIRNGSARYAVKMLSKKSIADEFLYEQGITDLAMEANFLAVIQHSHIIKVRGFRLGNFCQDGMFIMMDRLYETLDKAIVKWREQNKKYTGLMGSLKGGKEKAQELHTDRLQYGYDLASAFEHLHEKKIIYRDLKPENIGFDVRGDVKIFDFGLAKQLNNPNEDGTYNLTGYCGSPMYMAPEVIKCIPYNEKADVYSFTIQFWEMIALSRPYKKLAKVSASMIEKMVSEKNHRPEIDPKWAPAVKSVLEQGWDPSPKKRPSFTEIKKMIYDCVLDAGGDEELNTSIDKSGKSFRNLKI